ncbi:CBS domain-containing protein [Bacillus sp. 2205SS5-2]|uniref:CBS domain-containing protein n=1 Tax=Bacillus sp. 2205SS5-2 TaxID=3109031 RepID=UPI0030067757
MYVKSVMIPKNKCFNINKGESVQSALAVLETNSLDGIPVLDGEYYLGILTRYNVYQNYFDSGQAKEDYLLQTKVEDIATLQEKFIEHDEIFERTLVELKELPIIAVVDEERHFLGLVTRFDVMNQFQSAFGMQQNGVRITFTSVETEGRIARLSEIIKQFHESVISLVTFDDSDKLLRRIVLKIEKKDNIEKFTQKLERSGFRILHINEDE